MDQQTLNLTGVASAVVMIHAMLITELDKKGAISKGDFAKLLQDAATSAETQAPDHLKGRFRLDLKLMRNLAKHLEAPPPPQGWTPVVIDGDKE
jgi:hypothetical protein